MYQSILMCILLVACDNQEQNASAPEKVVGNEAVETQTVQEPSVSYQEEEYPAEPTEEELHTYTDEEKAALAAAATGIEKLFRINPFEYDCVNNNQAWSDDEFFERYISVIREDIENYIMGFDDEYYKSVISAEQIAQETEDCRRYVKELAESSRKAYDTALAWYDADFALNPSNNVNYQLQRNNFRNILRMRLLSELFTLASGDRTFWCSIFQENPYLPSAVDVSLDDFDRAVEKRGMGTTMGDIMAHNHILDVLNKRIELERECIRTGIYGDYGPSPQIEQVIQKFDASEKAWDEYRLALSGLLFPVYNAYYNGSGIPVWSGQFSIEMRTLHRKYLAWIAEAARGNYMQEVEMIDFTKSEDTPRAREARNKRPG